MVCPPLLISFAVVVNANTTIYTSSGCQYSVIPYVQFGVGPSVGLYCMMCLQGVPLPLFIQSRGQAHCSNPVGDTKSHAKHNHSIANGSTSPHHRLHVTVVRWVVQFCFWVMQGQISGKKEEHTSKQYIMAMCWIINHNLQTGSSLSISSLVVALAKFVLRHKLSYFFHLLNPSTAANNNSLRDLISLTQWHVRNFNFQTQLVFSMVQTREVFIRP